MSSGNVNKIHLSIESSDLQLIKTLLHIFLAYREYPSERSHLILHCFNSTHLF